jgi:hypothetical protein
MRGQSRSLSRIRGLPAKLRVSRPTGLCAGGHSYVDGEEGKRCRGQRVTSDVVSMGED